MVDEPPRTRYPCRRVPAGGARAPPGLTGPLGTSGYIRFSGRRSLETGTVMTQGTRASGLTSEGYPARCRAEPGRSTIVPPRIPAPARPCRRRRPVHAGHPRESPRSSRCTPACSVARRATPGTHRLRRPGRRSSWPHPPIAPFVLSGRFQLRLREALGVAQVRPGVGLHVGEDLADVVTVVVDPLVEQVDEPQVANGGMIAPMSQVLLA